MNSWVNWKAHTNGSVVGVGVEEEEEKRGDVIDPDSVASAPTLLSCLEDKDHKPRDPDSRGPYSAGFTGWECVCFI